jgi:hypothetical protein
LRDRSSSTLQEAVLLVAHEELIIATARHHYVKQRDVELVSRAVLIAASASYQCDMAEPRQLLLKNETEILFVLGD